MNRAREELSRGMEKKCNQDADVKTTFSAASLWPRRVRDVLTRYPEIPGRFNPGKRVEERIKEASKGKGIEVKSCRMPLRYL